MEKYSKYLHRLEKNQEISAEEKEAYIGIYRLLRQIEKGFTFLRGEIIGQSVQIHFHRIDAFPYHAKGLFRRHPGKHSV